MPIAIEPAFDDIDVGEFEGQDVEVYRAWRAEHGPAEPRCPAARAGWRRSAATPTAARACSRGHDAARVSLVVHDVPIRFLRNALLAADPLDGPVRTVANLERLSVGEAQLGAGLAVMRRRLSGLPPV